MKTNHEMYYEKDEPVVISDEMKKMTPEELDAEIARLEAIQKEKHKNAQPVNRPKCPVKFII